MDFGIRQLLSEEISGRRYHLFDSKGRLQLVADYASPWLPADEQNRVRFARSSGQLVASLDLPEEEGRVRNGRSQTSYALILNHAVYAILNKYQEKQGDVPPFFTIEADGVTWLAWNEADSDTLLTLYKEVPANLLVISDAVEAEALEPVGAIKAGDAYNFTVSLPVNPFHHAATIILALVFLFDQS